MTGLKKLDEAVAWRTEHFRKMYEEQTRRGLPRTPLLGDSFSCGVDFAFIFLQDEIQNLRKGVDEALKIISQREHRLKEMCEMNSDNEEFFKPFLEFLEKHGGEDECSP